MQTTTAAPLHKPAPAPVSAAAADLAGTAQRGRRWPQLPTWRQAWFQLHWLVGITAGSVLLVIGISGAILTFREECLDLINPGVRKVPVQAIAALTPQQLVDALARSGEQRRVLNVTMDAEPGAAPKVAFAPLAGERRGQSAYLDPYSGAPRPELHGAEFFEWMESLHRWLLLPREPGRVVAGSLAICLLTMALSGLYLRWPRRPLDWRAWLTFNPRLKGRSFLWGLHSVWGSWVLAMYLVSTSTGIYWSFDAVRDTVDGWAGVRRPPREAAPKAMDANRDASKPKEKTAAPVDMAQAWQVFQQQAGGWQLVTVRVPERPAQAVQFNWLAADAPHDRARNRMAVLPLTGAVKQNERYSEQDAAAHAIAAIYPLHMGTYFGLPGRIVMFLAALSLPLFAVTGWLLYLNRRGQKRAARLARGALGLATPPAGVIDGTMHDPRKTVLVAYASQSGQAERLALQSAAALQAAGAAVRVCGLMQLAPADLAAVDQALFVVSSFGEGEPPDNARRFAGLLAQGRPGQAGAALHGLEYAVLALGDRHYAQFCGFGNSLDRDLTRLGARAMFPLVEVDNGDAAALAHWSQLLSQRYGAPAGAMASEPAAAWRQARLIRRTLLNPGSQGSPLFEVALEAGVGDWQAGDLLEIRPRHPQAAVDGYLWRSGLSGLEPVRHAHGATLAQVMARSVLPQQNFSSAQACADSLQDLAPRSYSLASLPQDGSMQLLVRQERHERRDVQAGAASLPPGLGLCSGWLTEYAALDSMVELRLIANPSFRARGNDDAPCIFIGNGSGLAGLRAHLRARQLSGQHRNWLIFGERQRAYDQLCGAEIAAWHVNGHLQRLDLAYSRDAGEAGYVQDKLRAAAAELRQWVADGAQLYICGSLQGMGTGVHAALAEVLGEEVLEQLIAAGRYRRDVY